MTKILIYSIVWTCVTFLSCSQNIFNNSDKEPVVPKEIEKIPAVSANLDIFTSLSFSGAINSKFEFNYLSSTSGSKKNSKYLPSTDLLTYTDEHNKSSIYSVIHQHQKYSYKGYFARQVSLRQVPYYLPHDILFSKLILAPYNNEASVPMLREVSAAYKLSKETNYTNSYRVFKDQEGRFNFDLRHVSQNDNFFYNEKDEKFTIRCIHKDKANKKIKNPFSPIVTLKYDVLMQRNVWTLFPLVAEFVKNTNLDKSATTRFIPAELIYMNAIKKYIPQDQIWEIENNKTKDKEEIRIFVTDKIKGTGYFNNLIYPSVINVCHKNTTTGDTFEYQVGLGY